LAVGGSRTVDSFHRELGLTMWDHCGMARNETGLRTAIAKIAELREAFWSDVRVLGEGDDLNQSLEKAGRVADFLEFADSFAKDALHRNESCGGHFREESQTEEGEAKRDDENFSYAAAWEFQGVGQDSTLHKEDLSFEYVKLAQRSYK
jgi:succinate dehydrogenase / fumarate reductase flavoprotein subunit